MSFFETLIIDPKSEFLFEASHKKGSSLIQRLGHYPGRCYSALLLLDRVIKLKTNLKVGV